VDLANKGDEGPLGVSFSGSAPKERRLSVTEEAPRVTGRVHLELAATTLLLLAHLDFSSGAAAVLVDGHGCLGFTKALVPDRQLVLAGGDSIDGELAGGIGQAPVGVICDEGIARHPGVDITSNLDRLGLGDFHVQLSIRGDRLVEGVVLDAVGVHVVGHAVAVGETDRGANRHDGHMGLEAALGLVQLDRLLGHLNLGASHGQSDDHVGNALVDTHHQATVLGIDAVTFGAAAYCLVSFDLEGLGLGDLAVKNNLAVDFANGGSCGLDGGGGQGQSDCSAAGKGQQGGDLHGYMLVGEAGGASSGNFGHHSIAQIRGGPRALFAEIPGKLPVGSPRSQIMEPNCDMGSQAPAP